MQLEEYRSAFEALGVTVAGMTYDSLEVLNTFHAEQTLGYPLLKDVDAEHVNAYGIRNEDYEPGSRAYGIPHPGIIFVGADGVVKAKYAVRGYRKRPPFDELLEDVKLLSNQAPASEPAKAVE